jgi:hypothetical protein
MLNFNVKAEITTEIITKAISSADTNDQVAGNSDHAA